MWQLKRYFIRNNKPFTYCSGDGIVRVCRGLETNYLIRFLFVFGKLRVLELSSLKMFV